MAYWTIEIQSPGDELFTWPAVRVVAVQKGSTTLTALVVAEAKALQAVRKSPRVIAISSPPAWFGWDTHQVA
jgi:hypothetical protein